MTPTPVAHIDILDKSTIRIFESKLFKLENELKVLQSSLEIFNSPLSNVNNRIGQLESNFLNLEDRIIEEMKMKNRRSYNLVIFKLVKDTISSDSSIIKSMIICLEFTNTNFSIKRIGRNNAGSKPKFVCHFFFNKNIIYDFEKLKLT